MAIYHCSASMIRRSRGRSATAAAAYRAGEKITDERTGLVHDYRKKGGVDYTALLVPEQAPAELRDRATLWNAVERSEKRKDAQLAREIDVALPRELSQPIYSPPKNQRRQRPPGRRARFAATTCVLGWSGPQVFVKICSARWA